MSDPAGEAKARLLIEELNRRRRWLTILQNNRNSTPRWWKFFSILVFIFAVACIWESFDSTQAGAILALTIGLYLIMGTCDDDVHRRVDALVELLQQEGMLRSTLPTSHEDKPGDSPSRREHGGTETK